MSTWIMIGVFEDDLLALYPFICSFALPIFLGTLFMGLFYFQLIMNGSNKKIQAAIEKFENEHGKKFVKKQESIGSKFATLFDFLFCQRVPPSELTL